LDSTSFSQKRLLCVRLATTLPQNRSWLLQRPLGQSPLRRAFWIKVLSKVFVWLAMQTPNVLERGDWRNASNLDRRFWARKKKLADRNVCRQIAAKAKLQLVPDQGKPLCPHEKRLIALIVRHAHRKIIVVFLSNGYTMADPCLLWFRPVWNPFSDDDRNSHEHVEDHL
jgi:hypothetical protein